MAITNKEKTEVLAKTFAKVQGIENLNDKFLKRQELSGRRGRIQMRLQRRFIWIANNRQVKSASSGSQNPLPRR